MSRFFSDSERAALYLAAGGKCSTCGDPLAAGWHADHITPHIAGGPTDVVNGQALCPTCNLSKGGRMDPSLSDWQTECLRDYRAKRLPNYLVTATPGAGKTRWALAAAKSLLDEGEVDRVIVVVPTAHLRQQWETSASAWGLLLRSDYENRHGAIPADEHGVVITYAAVAAAPALYRNLTAQRRTLVVFDEIHHAGEAKTWGVSLRHAFEPAARRIALSGTPFRSDGTPIPFVEYDDARRCVSHWTYGYGRALQDGRVRSVTFVALDGRMKWTDAGVVVEGQLDNDDDEQAARALKSALEPNGEWIGSVLEQATVELDRLRESVPDAGGLVVAPDQFHARAYAAALRRITGEEPALAVSDEPDASARIATFAEGSSRWLVAVQMVSEGVDIPRLLVGVYASRTRTEMFFRQVVGRFVRVRDAEDDQCAVVLVPSLPPLLEFARALSEERDHALAEESERERKQSTEPRTLQFDLVEPLSSSAAVHHSTILSGDVFAEEELRRAEEMRQAAGLPSATTAAQVARLLRLAGASRPVGQAQVVLPASDPLADKRAMKRKVNQLVSRYATAADVKHSHVHATLNRHFNDTLPTATADDLAGRVDLLTQWLGAL